MQKQLDVTQITSEATRMRKGVKCAVSGNAHIGGSHQVFKVVFDDGVQWAARVPNSDSLINLELGSVTLFQHIKQKRPQIQAPAIYADTESRIIFTEWIGGEPLAVWNSQISLDMRHKFFSSLADFLIQLWTVPVEPELAVDKTSSYYA